MVNLTFGEQVKIILSRKGMTIKQLAELVENYTGKPMSRQNMTQRLGRDNFQEQDMRLIAEILGCKFRLSILETEELLEIAEMPVEEEAELEITEESVVEESESTVEISEESQKVEVPAETEEQKMLKKGVRGYFRKTGKSESDKVYTVSEKSAEKPAEKEELEVGEINPYTGKEYKTNSVRMHPKRIGYVQVYDQAQHKWADMTEWAFLGYQERKKALLGKDYEPPIYLD